MNFFRLKIIFVISLFVCSSYFYHASFSVGEKKTPDSALATTSEKQKTEKGKAPEGKEEPKKETKEETKKAKTKKVTDWLKGKLVGSAATVVYKTFVKLADKLIQDVLPEELKLSELLGFWEIPEGPVKKYLEEFIIYRPELEPLDTSLIISGSIKIAGKSFKSLLEIGYQEKDKKDKTEEKKKGAYIIFYIEAPDKWRLSELFPGKFRLDRMFPDKFGDSLLKEFKPDLFEFDDSFFMISTVKIPKHKKLGDVPKGIKFQSKVVPIELLKFVDKIFGFGGNPVEFEGKIETGWIGSKFKFKAPFNMALIPEKAKFDGKEYTLIKGFSVRQSESNFEIEIEKGNIPKLKFNGGITVDFPFLDETLELRAEMEFLEGTRLKMSGQQATPINNLFGIQGFNSTKAFKLGLVYDLTVAEKLAELTAEIGGVGALLPAGVIIGCGFKSSKSDIEIDAEMSVHGKRGIDSFVKGEGNLDFKDLTRFWVTQFTDSENALNRALDLTPYVILEDAKLDAAWTKGEKKFKLNVGKFEILKGYPATLRLDLSKEGMEGSGTLTPITVKDPVTDKILFSITRSSISEKTDPGKEPHFDIAMKVKPSVDFHFKIDGRVFLNLGKKLGTVESDTMIEISKESLLAKLQTSFLDFSSSFNVEAETKDKKIDPKTLQVKAEFDQKGLEKLGNLFKTLADDVFKKAREKLEEDKERIMKKIDDAANTELNNMEKKISDLEENIKNKKHACDTYNNELPKNVFGRAVCYLKEGIAPLTAELTIKKAYRDLWVKNKLKLEKLLNIIAIESVKKFLEEAEKISNKINKLIEKIDANNEKGVNLEHIGFEGKLSEFKDGPMVVLRGTILGIVPFDVKQRLNFATFRDIVNFLLKHLKIVKPEDFAPASA